MLTARQALDNVRENSCNFYIALRHQYNDLQAVLSSISRAAGYRYTGTSIHSSWSEAEIQALAAQLRCLDFQVDIHTSSEVNGSWIYVDWSGEVQDENS